MQLFAEKTCEGKYCCHLEIIRLIQIIYRGLLKNKANSQISIIVPVFNCEKTLEECVKSLLSQTHINVEIILVDDGSTDLSPAICDNYAVENENIRALHTENRGPSHARNLGLKSARGDYILYVDADDTIEPNACETLLEGMISDEIDFVVGGCVEIQKGKVIGYQRHTNIKEKKAYTSKEFIIRSIKANEWYAPACFNLYKKSFLISNCLYFREEFQYEDLELLPRLYLAADNIAYRNVLFYRYNIQDNSRNDGISTTKKDYAFRILEAWKARFDNLDDRELQRFLYGALVKHYLHLCRVFGICKWVIDGMGKVFAMRYSLNIQEKAKVLAFSIAPSLYLKIKPIYSAR